MDAAQLKAKRGTVKALLTKTRDRITEECTLEQLEIYEQNVEGYRTRYDNIQDELDELITGDEREAQDDYRFDIYESITGIKVQILDYKNKLLGTFASNLRTNTSSPGTQLSTTSNLTFVPYQEDETFTNFIKRLETFMVLKGNTDNKLKVYILLHALSPHMHEKLYNMCAPEEPITKDYDVLVEMLKDYFEPRPSVWSLQNRFICRTQEPNESIVEYATELKKLSQHCNFTCEKCKHCTANAFLTLQFIRGLQDTDIRIQLLQEKNDATFQEFINKAVTVEFSKSENQVMSTTVPTSTSFNVQPTSHQVKENHNSNYMRKPPNSKLETNDGYFSKLAGKCYRCGQENHKANVCKFRSEFCRKCNKLGHIGRVCMSQARVANYRKSHQVDDELPIQNEEYEVNVLHNAKSDKFMVNIHIEDRQFCMEVDTGAALSSISYADYKALNIDNKIFKTNVQMKTYTGETIKPKGVCFVTCRYKRQTFVGKLYIINQDVDPIFGRDWIREISLDWAEIKLLKSEENLQLEEILKMYEDVFTDKIGTIPNEKGCLILKPDATPIFFKPRPVPYSRKEKIEKELDRLEKDGILTKVEHSDWGTPIVPIDKPNGDIRICADYKVTLNKCIQDMNYPIPRIDDIFAQMNGGKYFCTLDLSKAYLHYEMDEQSAMLQSLSTHKGVYRVNRLMFGVKVAPGLWQQFMDKLLQGVPGVQCFFDDIIIQGSTYDELLKRLKIVLDLIRAQNLTLNRDKCKFFQKSINYLGHKIDEHGLHKMEDKILAIRNTKRPENVSELRTFLGMANYYNKFIPDLASILHPLNQLLRKGWKFTWTGECERSFNKVKEEICNENVLVHYNPDLPVTLATDASPIGLGAVLSHRYPDGSDRPIAFASRALTICEKNYSQIDKEATAIYWGIKKFFQYVYGRKFILITDNKPLTTIFNPYKSLPALSATRMLHYALFLSGFDYTIEYKRTSEHGNADYLSRSPQEPPDVHVPDQIYRFQANQIGTLNTITHQTIKQETKVDPNLSVILDALETGKCLKSLGYENTEITLQDGCLLKGTRVMIPATLRSNILQELHTGHLGMVKMKALGRSYCYWQNMDRDIEEMVRKCKYCCEKQNNPPKVQSHPWEPTREPWQRVHIDFAGPVNGLFYFIIVDTFSKWVEVIPTKTTTTDFCIKELRRLFTNFGICLVLVSDNGPQFTSHVFKNFLNSNGVIHKLSPAFHPASNGQAERSVQTIKNHLHCMADEPGDINLKISRLLMQLRKVPNAEGMSPYMLMLGRDVRTRLDILMKPAVSLVPENKSYKVSRSFHEGDRVQVRNYTRESKWKFGNVKRKEGAVHYWILLDDGRLWRRHVDQMRPTHYGGEG
ncbi:hypothetical protein M8J77_006027 [Diaphorina citri]|nr:hypothetical protein M8J77_006027 [Diaphorina citri]